jgi:hypothetical protein
MVKNPAEFFDNILEYLSDNFTKNINFLDLAYFLFPDNYFTVDEESFDKPTLLYQTNLNPVDKEIIFNALNFLAEENFVKIDYGSEKVQITSKGIFKINSLGFQQEIKDRIINNKLQRITWKVLPYCAIITAFCTLGTFIIALCKYTF